MSELRMDVNWLIFCVFGLVFVVSWCALRIGALRDDVKTLQEQVKRLLRPPS